MSQSRPAVQVTDARIDALQQIHPLPAAWQLQDTLVQSTTVGAIDLHMVGLVAGKMGQGLVAVGSAAETERHPIERAYFELLERVSLIDARQSGRMLRICDTEQRELGQHSATHVFPADPPAHAASKLSLSSGVALHTTWREACARARSELVERDRILRAWHGHCGVQRLATDRTSTLRVAAGLAPHYSAEVYEFGADGAARAQRVVGVFLWPSALTTPLVYGFAAAEQLHVAIASAEHEALQRLAFLWDEPLPLTSPFASPTPDYHQDYYLFPEHHALLRAWLAGGHSHSDETSRRTRVLFDGECTRFVDLTPTHLQGELFVAKAVSSHARRLRFGTASAGMPPHPIP
jgi:YcaO cyclodehydratase, ATP-ad Mg2+-binding